MNHCTHLEIILEMFLFSSTKWKKIFASHTSDKELITRTYRELKKLNSPKSMINKEMGN
jgi:hypothetical protein